MTRSWATRLVAADPPPGNQFAVERGFTVVEFLVSSAIVLVISGSIFGVLAQTERTAAYQMQVLEVLEDTRMALETIERILGQAGNDPYRIGFPAITIISPAEVRVQSDLTGSAGPGSPDKGDPDGDVDDANEDVTIRFDSGEQSIELVPAGTSAQPIASGITAFSLQYFDRNGNATDVGSDVTRIRVTITGASSYPDPQTGRVFSMQLGSDIQLAGVGSARPPA